MALYARDVLTGDMPGPYSDTDADHLAHLATKTGSFDRVSALPSAPDCHRRDATRRRRRRAPASVPPLPRSSSAKPTLPVIESSCGKPG